MLNCTLPLLCILINVLHREKTNYYYHNKDDGGHEKKKQYNSYGILNSSAIFRILQFSQKKKKLLRLRN